eukprot:2860917-Prorocentrum_lima.AAC.1
MGNVGRGRRKASIPGTTVPASGAEFTGAHSAGDTRGEKLFLGACVAWSKRGLTRREGWQHHGWEERP